MIGARTEEGLYVYKFSWILANFNELRQWN